MIIEISSGAEADLADGNTMLIYQSLLDDIATAFPLEPIPSEDDITRCT